MRWAVLGVRRSYLSSWTLTSRQLLSNRKGRRQAFPNSQTESSQQRYRSPMKRGRTVAQWWQLGSIIALDSKLELVIMIMVVVPCLSDSISNGGNPLSSLISVGRFGSIASRRTYCLAAHNSPAFGKIFGSPQERQDLLRLEINTDYLQDDKILISSGSALSLECILNS
jgi:hypothetical protein